MAKNSTLSTNEYFQRLDTREVAIYEWLEKKKLPEFAKQSKYLLKSLDRETILKEFSEGINQGVDACLKNPKIKGLDFSWYFDGDESDSAYAYGLDAITKTASLSKTDLGDKVLPGIECNLKHGSQVDSEFTDLPVFHSINLYVENLQDEIDENEDDNPQDTDSIVLNLFEIWNYKLAIEVCETLPDEKRKALAARSTPFWITMTRHERWPVAIASF